MKLPEKYYVIFEGKEQFKILNEAIGTDKLPEERSYNGNESVFMSELVKIDMGMRYHTEYIELIRNELASFEELPFPTWYKLYFGREYREEISATNQVVQDAGKQVAKDVRSPKCVRQGKLLFGRGSKCGE